MSISRKALGAYLKVRLHWSNHVANWKHASCRMLLVACFLSHASCRMLHSCLQPSLPALEGNKIDSTRLTRLLWSNLVAVNFVQYVYAGICVFQATIGIVIWNLNGVPDEIEIYIYKENCSCTFVKDFEKFFEKQPSTNQNLITI